MIPNIGPELIAYLLNKRPNGVNRDGKPSAERALSGALDKPAFLLKVRLTVVEITQPEKMKKEKEGCDRQEVTEREF
jgi:hypothetical protein